MEFLLLRRVDLGPKFLCVCLGTTFHRTDDPKNARRPRRCVRATGLIFPWRSSNAFSGGSLPPQTWIASPLGTEVRWSRQNVLPEDYPTTKHAARQLARLGRLPLRDSGMLRTIFWRPSGCFGMLCPGSKRETSCFKFRARNLRRKLRCWTSPAQDERRYAAWTNEPGRRQKPGPDLRGVSNAAFPTRRDTHQTGRKLLPFLLVPPVSLLGLTESSGGAATEGLETLAEKWLQFTMAWWSGWFPCREKDKASTGQDVLSSMGRMDDAGQNP